MHAAEFRTDTVPKPSIPRILHQTWKCESVPPQFLPFVEGWKVKHPSWEYRLWTDADNLELITTKYPHLLEMYNAFDNGVKRADVARYCILQTYGGVYVDLDFECIKPLDDLLKNREFVIGTEPTFHAKHIRNYPYWLCNAFIASVPGHRVFDYILEYIAIRVKDHDHTLNAVCVTGPDVIQNVFLQRNMLRGYDICVCKPHVLYPLIDTHNKGMFTSEEEREHYESIQRNLIRSKTYHTETFAVHHWAGTWWGKDQA